MALLGRRAAIGFALLMTMILGANLLVLGPGTGEAKAWYDGNPLSEAYANYGNHDIIANMSLYLLKDRFPQKAMYIDYWFLQDGADSINPSFKEDRTVPGPNDNFLAYNDDAPTGDAENYFINNRKGWEDTTAPSEIQKWANRTVENLTAWMINGMPNGSKHHHRAVYNLGILSHYMGDMSQFGHTDYSKWDQSQHPIYDPYDATFQIYYEQYVWEDAVMNELIKDFGMRTFVVPDIPEAEDIHQRAADVARWVNGRGNPPVQMVDSDARTITVGDNYKFMLESFRANWDGGKYHLGARGFDPDIWNLTVENMISATENLTTFYISIWDQAWENFLALSADLSIVDHTISPTDPLAGDHVTVTVTIRNSGPRDSGTFDCDLTVLGAKTSYGQPFNDIKPLSVPPYSERNVTFFNFVSGTGTVTMTVVADFTDRVNEANELDNMLVFSFEPIPEVHVSELTLGSPFPSIRRDTVRTLTVDIHNDGNRFDLFRINASTTSPGITLLPQTDRVGVLPRSVNSGTVRIMTEPDTALGSGSIMVFAEGFNTTSSLEVTFQILERTRDPVPIITGDDWARTGEFFRLSAASSTDPDGDALYFTWTLPDQGTRTGPEVIFNYSVPGEYVITLTVFDGNVSVSMDHTVTLYRLPPENLTASVRSRGVSSITIIWNSWPSGGLVAYWLKAEALPGQGERSEKGPFVFSYGPGNTSGFIGGFLPDTDMRITLYVEALRFGNVSMADFETSTESTAQYRSLGNLEIANRYLYLRYKPWLEPLGRRDPSILLEREYKGEFVMMDLSMMDPISTGDAQDTVRFALGSNFGSYRVSLTYLWADGTTAFTIENSTGRENVRPGLSLVSTSTRKEQDENGTALMHLQFIIADPEDSLWIEVDWGDGTSEDHGPLFDGMNSLFHNYTEAGDYTIRLVGTDYTGDVVFVNTTIKVVPYIMNISKDKGPNLILTIIGVTILGIILAAVIGYAGFKAYRASQKQSEIEFDREKHKGKMDLKPGTGTDFDQRRTLQIPKESIMKGATPPGSEGPAVKETAMAGAPILTGQIVFDEE